MIIWKTIRGFPDYEISNDGRVRFLGGTRAFGLQKRIAPPGERKAQPHTSGYLQIRLQKNRKGYNRYIHRLVAEAFFKKEQKRKWVNHKNGIKTDNRLENLEWSTVSENALHKTRVLLKGAGETHSQAKLNNDDITMIRKSNLSDKQIAKLLGISRQHVNDIRGGRKWATQAARIR